MTVASDGVASRNGVGRTRSEPGAGEVVFYRLHPRWTKVDRFCGMKDRSYVVRHVNALRGHPQALARALRALFHRHWDVPRSVVRDVSLVNARATVDLRARDELGWASTSCGSISFVGSLLRTTFQFDSIDSVRFLLEGSCRNFGAWLQSGRCDTFERSEL